MVAENRRAVVPWLDAALALAATIAALVLAHGRRLVANFGQPQWEDGVFFRYTREHVHSVLDAFRLPGPYPGLYRPLTTNLFYFLGRHLFGERVAGYHVVILAFFILNAVLLHRIAFRLVPSRWALVAPVLWASRLANVEVVTHICEFQGLLSATGVLLAVDWFADDRPGRSAAACAVALLAKETALVLPMMLLAYHLTIERKRTRAFTGPVAVTAIWLAVAILRPHTPTGFGYDVSPANILRNVSAYLLTFSNLLVGPLRNPSDWVLSAAVRHLAAHPAAQVAVALLIVAYLGTLGRRAGDPRRLQDCGRFGVAWFLVAILPVALFRDRLFMRYAYLAHAGLALAACAVVAAAGGLISMRRGDQPAGARGSVGAAPDRGAGP